MKKFLQKTLAVLALCLVSMSAMAQDAVFSFTRSGEFTSADGKITVNVGYFYSYGATQVVNIMQGDGKNTKFTCNDSNKKFQKIVLTGYNEWTAPKASNFKCVDAAGNNVGEFAVDKANETVTWTGSSSVVNMMGKGEEYLDFGFSGAEIWLEDAGAPATKTWTVSVTPSDLANAGVVYADRTYGNGAEIETPTSAQQSAFSAAAVAGWTASALSFDENTISVVYSKDIPSALPLNVSFAFNSAWTEIALNGANLPSTISSSINIKEGDVFSKNDVTITIGKVSTSSSDSRFSSNKRLEVTNGPFTIAAPSGYVITALEFINNYRDSGYCEWGNPSNSYITSNCGTLTVNSMANATWTGESESVTINNKTYKQYYYTINVTLKRLPLKAAVLGQRGSLYYGTAYADYDFEVPANYTAYVASNFADGVVTLTALEGAVPAETAVILEGTSANANLTLTVATGDLAKVDANYLKGTLTASPVAPAAGNALYKLSYDTNGENLGFYWGAEGGAGFTNGANKAYLEVPYSAGSNGISFKFNDDVTGINAIATESNDAIYNLQGQRVNATAAGIYVKNGKKFIVK